MRSGDDPCRAHGDIHAVARGVSLCHRPNWVFNRPDLIRKKIATFLCAAQSHAPTHFIFNQNDVNWSKGPASLPPGAEVAVLEGDPAKEGQFTMRLRLPDGYVPPHWHPKVEHVTVFFGAFPMGMGERFDEKV